MNNPQKIADTYGFEAERAYETWRSWQHQWVLQDIERRLQGEGRDRARRSSRLARVISWLLAAAVIASAFALAYVYRWLLSRGA